MAMMDIGDDEFASLLDVSAISARFAQGSLGITIGRHPELGDFAVVQTMAGLGREFILATSTDEDVAVNVLDDWGARSSADMARITAEYAAKLDQAATNRQG